MAAAAAVVVVVVVVVIVEVAVVSFCHQEVSEHVSKQFDREE